MRNILFALAIGVAAVAAPIASGSAGSPADTVAGLTAAGSATAQDPSSGTTPTTRLGATSGQLGGIGSGTYAGALPFAYVPEPITDRSRVANIAADFATSRAAGISWKFRWSDLETAPGKFDWTPIDNVLQASASISRPVILRVIAGMYSPSWVLRSVPTVRVPNSFFPNPAPFPNPTVIPVVWNSTYLSDWATFVRAFGSRFNGHRGIYAVEISGAGVIGDMYLPPDMTAWNAAGFSNAKLLSAWHQIVTTFDRSFPSTPVALAINEAIDCAFGSAYNPTCARSFHSNVMLPLVSWIESTYPHHVYLQNNGLKAKYLFDGIHYTRKALRSALAYTHTGYQVAGEIGSATELYDAFEVARMDQVAFVEVYPGDILGAAYAQDLNYLRYG
jgi:hypothetical protein